MLKNAKKCSVMLLILSITATSVPSYSYADYTEGNDILSSGENFSIGQIDSNTYEVHTKNKNDTISIFENDFERVVTIKNENTNQEDIIRLNKISGNIYSSITNEIVNLNSSESLSLISDNSISLLSKNKPPHNPMISYETKYISFSEIKKITGSTGTAAQVVGAFMFLVPGLQGTSGGVQAVGVILNALSTGIPDDSYHGFKLNIKTARHYRYRGGHWGLRTTNHYLTNVSRY